MDRNRNNPNTPRSNRNKVCYQFIAGKCTFRNCKFTHEKSDPPRTPGQTPRQTPGQTSTQTPAQTPGQEPLNVQRPIRDATPTVVRTYGTNDPAHRRFRRTLGNKNAGRALSPLSPDQAEQLLTDALTVLGQDAPDSKQDLLKDLGGEAGADRIRQLTEATYVTHYTVTSFSFEMHCVPFLKLLSLPEIRTSLVAEKAVSTIYNIVYGISGRRAIKFFQDAAENLRTVQAEARRNGDDKLFQTALPALTSTLYNTLDINQSATVQPEFKEIVKSLRGCLDLILEKADYFYRCAENDIARLKDLLQMADSLPSTYVPPPVSTPADMYTPQIPIDLPGHLSVTGVRHDNDHVDISRIKILPTSSEIRSERDDFLPQKAPESSHHLNGLKRVIDSQFRLLREDTSGQIKQTIRMLYKRWDDLVNPDGKNKQVRRERQQGLFIKTATNPVMKNFKFDRRGLELNVTFDQPKKAKNLTPKQRHDFWETYKFLKEGNLLCILDDMQRCVFFTVAHRAVRYVRDRRPNRNQDSDEEEEPEKFDPNEIRDLAGNANRAMITLRFAQSPAPEDIATVMDWIRGSNVCLLVEFSSILFVAFEPVLKCLQTISKFPRTVPFSKWITANPNYQYQSLFMGFGNSAEVKVPPPLYLTKPQMTLDFSSIAKHSRSLTFSTRNPLSVAELAQNTTLDNGQCAAVIATFTRELALIQGPPGTGKSYVGDQIVKVLLANRKKTNIGPIVCVCYTNHALDQFLEHILDTTDKVIRLGGQSKNDTLKNLSLRTLSKEIAQTRQERSAVWEAQNELRGIESRLESSCKKIFSNSQNSLHAYLNEFQPEQCQSLFGGIDGDGFETVVSGDRSKVISEWLRGTGARDRPKRNIPTSDRPLTHFVHEQNLFRLSIRERQKLKNFWEFDMRKNVQEEMSTGLTEYDAARNDLSSQYQSRDLRILNDCHVIGVTTNGLAKYSDMLRSLSSKVLIVEEAAEVLEAHLLTAFLPKLEHAILIGDHLQLRPQIANYELSMEHNTGKLYAFDESLFERLTNERYNDASFPFSTLDTQRRMHPSISSLIRNTLYPELRDHEATRTHPEVVGMARRLFWYDHRNLETGAGVDKDEVGGTSHTNKFEVDFTVGLVRHLVRQGVYKQKEIAVLTPYLGQLKLLREKLNSVIEVVVAEKDQEDLEKKEDEENEAGIWGNQKANALVSQELRKGKLGGEVKIATIDNFQGEEAKVIIVSLVRSNLEKNVGFLKTSNRINVLLSRAKDGMYIIGNATTSSRIKMWSDVLKEMEENRNLGPHLELRCPRHPEKSIFVTTATDFVRHAPEGGCDELCSLRLNCGHPCRKKCHSKSLHLSTPCLEPCQRGFKNCAHPCPKVCSKDCGLCMHMIGPMELPCGHIYSNLSCHQSQNLSQVRCQVEVTRKVPLCGHEVTMECHMDVKKYKCKTACGDLLPCGHKCLKACHNCKRKIDTGDVVAHGNCTQPCGRNYTTCKHNCREPCHGGTPCKLCERPCEIRCKHSRCGKKCSEPCAPCAESCNWTCEHRDPCQMPCAVPCDIIPCSKRCEKLLACKHQCPSVCGETCPPKEICQICGGKDKLDRPVDYITFEKYSDINLDEDPIIYLSCGHFFTVGTFDGLMEMNEAYHVDPMTNNILFPKPLPELSKTKSCPECRQPLLDIHRYNRVVKSAFLAESTKRFCAFAQDAYVKLYKEVSDKESELASDTGRTTFLARFIPQTAGAAPAAANLLRLLEETGNLAEEPIQPTNPRARPRAMPNDLFNQMNHILARLRSSNLLIQKVEAFVNFATEAEQPYGKVYRLVEDAKKRRGVESSFQFDNSAVQLSYHLKGQALYLQLKWANHWDAHNLTESDRINEDLRRTIRNQTDRELVDLRERCNGLLEISALTNSVAYEVEARIYRAKFSALQLLHAPAAPGGRPAEAQALMNSELESLDVCLRFCETHQGTAGKYEPEIEKAKKLLNGGTFYSFVSDAEKKLIFEAMASTMSGTGHWYTCENGHLFAIANCGMPMELARCNECGARVGGQNHRAVAGVQSAGDFERRFGNMQI